MVDTMLVVVGKSVGTFPVLLELRAYKKQMEQILIIVGSFSYTQDNFNTFKKFYQHIT